ncbi:MAG: hypothetical protein NC084_13285 [Bacteroides sp.]|nr:hypothetical protein [Eubacterium sp.]MCM1419681.1 hypothetical protein [Roseburia sp.]MCM1463670.1 hypothetical protein [Bacteroides sp.]
MKKYKVSGTATVICEMEVTADSPEEAIEKANAEFGSLSNYAGMGSCECLIGVDSSEDGRCIYPDSDVVFDDAEEA